ncbi:target of rapamycin complex subunit lst8-like isoform X1 [Dinothrombium tinctorium]|uniref:Target of rapamycin complex subunit lst8 n=1 Tax=Dinothrombium tinctorium TaxID=1965070 RepID=A0A3S3PQJ8_9ACAR|nr:target of rapamycin complex subunit lst8-like isoform X1 [Dinothrombium tinctorium]
MVSGETKESSKENTREAVILASGGYDHTIRFWSPHNGQCLRIVQHPDSQINSLAINHDKSYIAAAGFQHIRLFELQGQKNPNPIYNFEGISKNVTAVGFQEVSDWMYTTGEDGTIRVWDYRSRSPQAQRVVDIGSPINGVALHPNQTDFYVGDQSGRIVMWDVRTSKPLQYVVDPDVSIQHVTIEPEANYMAAVDNKGNCYVFFICTNIVSHFAERRLKFRAHKRYALKCKFTPDCTLLVTTSADQTAKLWRTSDLEPLLVGDDFNNGSGVDSGWQVADHVSPHAELKDANQRWVWDVAFSNDSQYIITGSSDSTARLWGVNDAEIKREYSGHQKAITALAFVDGVPDSNCTSPNPKPSK